MRTASRKIFDKYLFPCFLTSKFNHRKSRKLECRSRNATCGADESHSETRKPGLVRGETRTIALLGHEVEHQGERRFIVRFEMKFQLLAARCRLTRRRTPAQ